MPVKALLVVFFFFCHKEQWSLAASGRLQNSPQQWVERLLGKPSLCQLTFSSAALMWKGDGERSPLSPVKKTQMKGKAGIPKAASNRAGFHQIFRLMKKWDTSEWIYSFFLRTTASWFFPLNPLHHFPSVSLLVEGKGIKYLHLFLKSCLWTWFHIFKASLYVL